VGSCPVRKVCNIGTRPELRNAYAAAQTRIVSEARIRLDFWKFVRPFKGIICDDISEFESYHPRQAVGSLAASSGLQKYVRMTHLLTGLPENFCHLVRHDAA
jgi:hypothetical protein